MAPASSAATSGPAGCDITSQPRPAAASAVGDPGHKVRLSINPSVNGSVSVHRLVQAVTLGQMSEDLAEAWRQAASALVEAALPEDPTAAEDWPVYALLLPHAQAALGRGQLAAWGGSPSILGHSGSYAGRPGSLCTRCLMQRVQACGPEHRDTLFDRASLAVWTGRGGGSGRRPRPVRRAAAGDRAGPGPEHTATLVARGNLAHLDRGRREMRPGPATSSPRCCRSASGCSAPSTPTP